MIQNLGIPRNHCSSARLYPSVLSKTPARQMLRLLVSGAATVRSPPAAAFRRLLHYGGGGARSSGDPVSVAYHMSMLRRPSSVRKKGLTWNSCSLIGRLDTPVTPFEGSSDEYPRAYTFLSVRPSLPASSSNSSILSVPSSSPTSSSNSSNFRVTLQLKGELANACLKHLKQDDLVYVSGFLGSYHRVNESGEMCIFYKIYVYELNCVLDQNKKSQDGANSIGPPSTPSVTSQMLKENRCIDRLRLWQVFFANPYEWWDNRQSKPYASCPDFKHKDTREKIWLQPDDPPWVRKQLELHDLEVAENGRRGNGRLVKNHNWKAQDFDYFADEVQQSAEA